jgi:hypothetical protein
MAQRREGPADRLRRRGLTRARLRETIAARLSPDATRRPTFLERLTVERIPWDLLVRLNRYLALLGKLATGVWVLFIASLVVGLDWKHTVEDAVNSGKAVKGAIVLVIVVPTLLFVAARSLIGFARWRVPRELWRRDVARLEPGRGDAPEDVARGA